LWNAGRVPATNLILTITTPSNIGNPQVFSTENPTKTVEGNVMNVYIPRLAHGDGGLVQLTFSSDQYSDSPQPAGYTVSTRYDQGSWRIDSSTPNRIY
jgi:hypothetical protein